MFRGCLPFIVLLLFGGYYASSTEFTFLQPLPGQRAEQVDSPTGQFTAQLWRRCCDAYPYITAFTIRDRETGMTHRQIIMGQGSSAAGEFFEWTPSEHYLVITTDIPISSHGCDDLIVYAGDGSAVAYSSRTNSICHSLGADASVDVIAFCENDDILFSSGFRRYRVTPSTGVSVQTEETSCGGE